MMVWNHLNSVAFCAVSGNVPSAADHMSLVVFVVKQLEGFLEVLEACFDSCLPNGKPSTTYVMLD